MFNRIQIREILAWITLAIAIVLFSATLAFSQTKSINVENEDGKVHVKIIKTDKKGNAVRIDTTFTATDDTDVDKIIEDLVGKDDDSNSHTEVHVRTDKGSGKKKNIIVIDSDDLKMSKEQKEKLHDDIKESMKDMKHGLEEMKKSLESMHIKVDSDDEGANSFHFNFNIPDEGEEPNSSNCDDNTYTYHYSKCEDKEVDSLKDDEHIVIVGGKDEKPPELEKVISSKKGKQIFVYKRSGSEKGNNKKEKGNIKDDQKNEKPDIQNLDYYPNPSNGKFKVSFHSDDKKDLAIEILDSNSKEVYSEKLNDFQGDYSKEIDLGNKSKGNYFLKITQGKKSLTKKIVVN